MTGIQISKRIRKAIVGVKGRKPLSIKKLTIGGVQCGAYLDHTLGGDKIVMLLGGRERYRTVPELVEHVYRFQS
jgi:hypothetical protein